jgi:hypothetical protein
VADHYAKLKSPQMLRSHMEYKQHTPTSLAASVTRERERLSEKGVSRQMISYLLAGTNGQRPVNSCSPDLAAAIERVLDVPDHTLFDVLPKSRDKRELAKADAA